MFRYCVSGPFTSDKWNRVRMIIGIVISVLVILAVGLLVHHFTKGNAEEEEEELGAELKTCYTCASCEGKINCSSLGLPIDAGCKSSPKYMTTCKKGDSCYRVEATGKQYSYFLRKCSKCPEEKKHGCRTSIYKHVNTTFCYCNADRCVD